MEYGNTELGAILKLLLLIKIPYQSTSKICMETFYVSYNRVVYYLSSFHSPELKVTN